MALETLKELKSIDGVKICHLDGSGELTRDFITIDNQTNAITFKIQSGAIKEKGVNGCQVDHIILVVTEIIRGLNVKFPCKENENAIQNLHSAYGWLDTRTKEREDRGVEGTSQK